jgi:hypothetical protein
MVGLVGAQITTKTLKHKGKLFMGLAVCVSCVCVVDVLGLVRPCAPCRPHANSSIALIVADNAWRTVQASGPSEKTVKHVKYIYFHGYGNVAYCLKSSSMITFLTRHFGVACYCLDGRHYKWMPDGVRVDSPV